MTDFSFYDNLFYIILYFLFIVHSVHYATSRVRFHLLFGKDSRYFFKKVSKKFLILHIATKNYVDPLSFGFLSFLLV